MMDRKKKEVLSLAAPFGVETGTATGQCRTVRREMQGRSLDFPWEMPFRLRPSPLMRGAATGVRPGRSAVRKGFVKKIREDYITQYAFQAKKTAGLDAGRREE